MKCYRRPFLPGDLVTGIYWNPEYTRTPQLRRGNKVGNDAGYQPIICTFAGFVPVWDNAKIGYNP